MADMNDDDLLEALGVEVPTLKTATRTPREERIIAGFEDIQRFYQTHGRAPLHGEDRDIFERLYAVRLDQLRKLPEAQTRIAGADKDATYLLADVEVVATYKLHNLNRTRLENIFHRLFGAAQLDLTIEDRFGHPVKPREWFLVPLHVIDEAVERIRDGSITGFAYDPQTARLVSEGAIKA
ncbi:GIY-YIG nuclease family protein [Pseudomonas aeruginosa]